MTTSTAHNLRIVTKDDHFPSFNRPSIIGFYSIDEKRQFLPSSKNLKYLFRPSQHDEIDLNSGFATYIPKAETSENEEKIDSLFHWINHNQYFKTLTQVKYWSFYLDLETFSFDLRYQTAFYVLVFCRTQNALSFVSEVYSRPSWELPTRVKKTGSSVQWKWKMSFFFVLFTRMIKRRKFKPVEQSETSVSNIGVVNSSNICLLVIIWKYWSRSIKQLPTKIPPLLFYKMILGENQNLQYLSMPVKSFL